MKKLLSILLSVAMLLSVTSLTVFADETDISLTSSDSVFAGGSGTEDDPYQVSTPEQLNEVRNYLDKHFVQINNIDMTAATSEGGTYWNDGTGWIPIGTSDTPFTGTYDGHGFKILGLNIYAVTSLGAGLFGNLSNSTVKNITLTNGEYRIDGENKTGVYIGGIVARQSYSEIINCVNYNNLFIEDFSYTCIGGICASSGGMISKCYNYGNISINNMTSNVYCGGICARTVSSSNTKIQESVNYGTIEITLDKPANIGGICGELIRPYSLSRCCNYGNIYATLTKDSDKGGTSGTKIGGISGANYGGTKVEDCYNIGNIDIDYEYSKANIGGLSGYMDYSTIGGTYYSPSLKCSYNIGQIDGDGLVSYSYSTGYLTYCYTTNDSTTAINSSSVKNLLNDEMTVKDSFVGFDFDTVWNISANINNGMPYLRALYKNPPSMIVGGISFNVTLEESVGHLIAALYDENGVLQNVKKYIAEENITVTFDKGKTGSYAKIFWWDDIGSMKPLCDAQTIQLQ